MDKVVLLCRVSTFSQDYERQINELTEYAIKHEMIIMKVFCNKISGAKKNEERPEITELIKYVSENDVDKVLVCEISRLGRNTYEALKVIELLNENRICLYVKNYNIYTLDRNGNLNSMAQFMCTILLETARMERLTIRQRMESGYKNYQQNGGKVGRKVGYRKTDDMIKNQYIEEVKLLKKGISLRNISKITGRSVNTLRKVKSTCIA